MLYKQALYFKKIESDNMIVFKYNFNTVKIVIKLGQTDKSCYCKWTNQARAIEHRDK